MKILLTSLVLCISAVTGLVSIPQKAIADEPLPFDLNAEKTTAHAFATQTLASYTQANYSSGNWSDMLACKASADSIIDTAVDMIAIQLARSDIVSCMTAVNPDLVLIKENASTTIVTAYTTRTSENFTPENYTLLTTYRDEGLAGIVAAQNQSEVDSVRAITVNQLISVPAIPVELSLSATSSQISLTDQNKSVSITVPSDVVDPLIDVSAFITAGTGTLPQLSINAVNLGGVVISFASSTSVTSSDIAWNGVMHAPTPVSITLPATAGQIKTLISAFEIGVSGTQLTFNRAVRILIPGQAGKRTGFVTGGEDFKEVTTGCVADDQISANALAADAECKLDVGADLVIWTKHFTSFATYTQAAVQFAPSRRSSSGGGGGGYTSTLRRTTATTTNATIISRVLGAESYRFTTYLRYGMTDAAVKELQDKLRLQGFFTYPTSTGYFGSVTLSAVKAFQASRNLPTSGYVGPVTVAELNK
ncbi:MAG: hypothetical protein RLZZ67_605 [Candidatus Parcubacteria bacterium]|jgi:hypothetical protein